jgi:hypothetical protein
MSIAGYYYLHVNGGLIFKPGTDCAADIRESDLARMLWPCDPSDRFGAWRILVEALALGADSARIAELADKWHCDDMDADEFAKRIDVRLEMDGDAWCATGPGFANLQESPAGFGKTKLEAMSALARDMGFKASKMWGATFPQMLEGMPA